MVSEDVVEARSRRLGLQHGNYRRKSSILVERRCARPETPAIGMQMLLK